LTSETAEGAALKRDLLSRAQGEFARQGKFAAPVCEILRPLQSPQVQKNFMRDVVLPAMKRQLSTKDCTDRLIVLLKTKTPILDAIECYFGPLRFTVGGGAEAGAGFGIEGSVGLAFHRRAGGRGARDHARDGGLRRDDRLHPSGGGRRLSHGGRVGDVDVSVSGASGVAGEFLISLKPALHPPPPLLGKETKAGKEANLGHVYRGILVDYEYAGCSVSMGVGAGLGGAIGLTGSSTFLLNGVL